jgi:hypothetical protein
MDTIYATEPIDLVYLAKLFMLLMACMRRAAFSAFGMTASDLLQIQTASLKTTSSYSSSSNLTVELSEAWPDLSTMDT